MRYNELNKKFNNEKDAFEYRDEIWFGYRIIGDIYNTNNRYSVEFNEEVKYES